MSRSARRQAIVLGSMLAVSLAVYWAGQAALPALEAAGLIVLLALAALAVLAS